MSFYTPIVDNRLVLDSLFARGRFPCMSVGLELELFEALHTTPASAGALAARLGLNPRAMRAILPVMAAGGLLTVRDGVFGLTATARTYLLKSSPFYFGPKLLTQARTSNEHTQLIQALKTVDGHKGNTGLPRPVDGWEAGDIPPDLARTVAAYMQAECAGLAIGAAQSGVFAGTRRMLDVGGGSGALSIAIANHQPKTRSTVLDLPTMCDVAMEYIEAAGRIDRVDTLALDMFRQAWPRGYDGMVFSNIYHDWRFDTCALLSRLAFEALEAGGRIFLHEMLYEEGHAGPLSPAGFSVQMLLGTQGQQFTFAELRGVLEAAGFTDSGVIHTSGYYSVVTGRKG
jgi:acetylserotonin N-methyltransferase